MAISTRTKNAVLKALDTGMTKTAAAKKYAVSTATVSKWTRNKITATKPKTAKKPQNLTTAVTHFAPSEDVVTLSRELLEAKILIADLILSKNQ